MAEKKTYRAPNFTATEVNLLTETVLKYADIIENKRTDGVTNRDKTDCWIKITDEFNSLSTRHRTMENLKGKYENMKKTTKDKVGDLKKYRKGTGGGRDKVLETNTLLTENEHRLAEVLGKRATGLSSKFDGDRDDEDDAGEDFVHDSDEGNVHVEIVDVEVTNQHDIDGNIEIFTPTWNSYTPSMLQGSKSKELKDRVLSRERMDSRASTSNAMNPNGSSANVSNVKGSDAGHAKGSNASHAKGSSAKKTAAEIPNDPMLAISSPMDADEEYRVMDALESKRLRDYKGKITEWAAGRADLVNLQRKAFLDKQKLEMENMRESHAKKLRLELDILELQKKEVEERIKYQKEKADLEIAALRRNISDDFE